MADIFKEGCGQVLLLELYKSAAILVTGTTRGGQGGLGSSLVEVYAASRRQPEKLVYKRMEKMHPKKGTLGKAG